MEFGCDHHGSGQSALPALLLIINQQPCLCSFTGKPVLLANQLPPLSTPVPLCRPLLTPLCPAGSTPCCCDFCHMGKPPPDSIYMQNQQATRGLQLRRGPDPRSYDPVKAGIAAAGRGLYGMPM